MAAPRRIGRVPATGLPRLWPSIVTPFAADRPFWERRAYELGVGLRPPQAGRQLTAERLAAAVADREMRARSERLAAALRARAESVLEYDSRATGPSLIPTCAPIVHTLLPETWSNGIMLVIITLEFGQITKMSSRPDVVV